MNFKKLFLCFFILSFFNGLYGAKWETYFKKNTELVQVLQHIARVNKIEGLSQPVMQAEKKSLKGYLDAFNNQGPTYQNITKYLASKEGHEDKDFENVLKKTKKILEVWYGEKVTRKNIYPDLWLFLNNCYTTPAPASDTPPPLPPRPVKNPAAQQLKDKLLALKKGLSDLRGKLQKLSPKLTALKKTLVESSTPLGVFDNSDSWWDAAIANPGKTTETDKVLINTKWENLKTKEFPIGLSIKLAYKGRRGKARVFLKTLKQQIVANEDDLRFINKATKFIDVPDNPKDIFDQENQTLILWINGIKKN